MATSSIFESVKITDQKTAERFVAALEASEKDQQKKIELQPYRRLRDPEEIRKFFFASKKIKH